ncbi:hypothetical protein ACJ41O_009047 [Fusarium nematophilum]
MLGVAKTASWYPDIPTTAVYFTKLFKGVIRVCEIQLPLHRYILYTASHGYSSTPKDFLLFQTQSQADRGWFPQTLDGGARPLANKWLAKHGIIQYKQLHTPLSMKELGIGAIAAFRHLP